MGLADRCGPLSPECERFFVQEACFYEYEVFDANVAEIARLEAELDESSGLDTSIIAVIAVLAVFATLGVCGASWLIRREKSGTPLFGKLQEQGVPASGGTTIGNTA